MPVTDSKEVNLRQPLNIRLQDVRILVNLIRVIWMKADSRGEGELSNAVLPFLVNAPLRGVVALLVLLRRRIVTLQLRGRRRPARWIV